MFQQEGYDFMAAAFKGGLQWKRFILSELQKKPVPAMPAAGRKTGRAEH
jgi:hypothetical protein